MVKRELEHEDYKEKYSMMPGRHDLLRFAQALTLLVVVVILLALVIVLAILWAKNVNI